MTVRNALLALAGSAWELCADERARRVCFVAQGDAAEDEENAGNVQIFPIAGAQR